MFVGKPLPFISDYVKKLSQTVERHQADAGLSPGRQAWLSFCIMCIIVTESICWRKFVRAGLGTYSEALLSWYFRGPMTWGLLLSTSVNLVLKNFGICEGILVIDDTGKKRSKVTSKIPFVHYFKDKDSSGTIRGQEMVLLVLVTPLVTIPISFEFYQPDPEYTKWDKQNKRLRKQGVPSSSRPPKPAKNPNYPTKQELALRLLEQFSQDCPQIGVKAILADCLYGTCEFVQQSALKFSPKQSALKFSPPQVISQLQHNQKVSFRGRSWHLDDYFNAYPGVPQTIQVRGGKTKPIMVGSARLYVEAHKCKRFVIAIHYPEESEYRYLVASDLSWRTLDIVQTYTFRWLVETVIEDLKIYEGWGSATKQPGVEGSRRSLSLSLLCDHCLILHPEQQACVTAQKPLYTIGSLQRHLKIDAFIYWLEQWLEGEELANQIEQLSQAILPLVPKLPSSKHMNGRDLGRLEPTQALKYRALDAIATT
jgi:hypothetical protein